MGSNPAWGLHKGKMEKGTDKISLDEEKVCFSNIQKYKFELEETIKKFEIEILRPEYKVKKEGKKYKELKFTDKLRYCLQNLNKEYGKKLPMEMCN